MSDYPRSASASGAWTSRAARSSKVTIAKIEAGSRPLQVAEMYALSHAFGMPPGAVYFMAYTNEDPGGFDGLTRLLASEEEQCEQMRATMLRHIETTIDIVADHQTRMNSLVDAMRETAAKDPSLADEIARVEERWAVREKATAGRNAADLQCFHDETLGVLNGEGRSDGECQAEA